MLGRRWGLLAKGRCQKCLEFVGAIPSERASVAEAMTPAAGPDSMTYAGRSAAALLAMTPPLDCMISSGASKCSPSSLDRSASRYEATIGRTYAFRTVVLVRSYSRMTGKT